MIEQSAVNSAQSDSPQTQDEKSIWDSIPTVDETDMPEDQEDHPDEVTAQAGEEDEADEPADDVPPVEEIEIDGQKISKDEIKQLVDLKQSYTQQRQQDVQQVRQIQTEAHEVVANVQQNAVQQVQWVMQSARQLFFPNVTPEYLMQLASQDPSAAERLNAQLNAFNMWERQAQGIAGDLWQQSQFVRQQGIEQAKTAQQQELQTEAQKLMSKKWFTPEFDSQAIQYAIKHGIPAGEAKSITRSGAYEIIYKAMLYDRAKSGMKNKQVQSSSVTPGSRAANGKLADKQSFKQLEQRALKGDPAARAKYVKALIPTI